MKTIPDSFEQMLASLYDEPISHEETAAMSERLCDFVGLLLEIQNESQGAE